MPVALLFAVAMATAGCGPLLSGISGASTATGSRLAEATFLDDPRSHVGPSTALLAEPGIQPIAGDAVPVLPATVVDAQGTEVTVHDVSRILALDLSGTTARTVFELGLGDNVVGRDISSGFADIQDRPLVTQNGHELNGEAILELAPSVIITDTSLGPWDVILQMREAGVPVVVVDSHRSIDTVGSLVQQVADSLGVSERGEQLAARAQAAIDDMAAQIAEIVPPESERLRMVFLYVRGQSGIYYLFGPGSGTDELIVALGGIDVASDIGWEGMRPMTDEGLIAAAPDLVLVMTKGLASVDGVDGLLDAVPALALSPAGEKRRIVDMEDTQILSFGTNTADILEALAVAIYAPETPQPDLVVEDTP